MHIKIDKLKSEFLHAMTIFLFVMANTNHGKNLPDKRQKYSFYKRHFMVRLGAFRIFRD